MPNVEAPQPQQPDSNSPEREPKTNEDVARRTNERVDRAEKTLSSAALEQAKQIKEWFSTSDAKKELENALGNIFGKWGKPEVQLRIWFNADRQPMGFFFIPELPGGGQEGNLGRPFPLERFENAAALKAEIQEHTDGRLNWLMGKKNEFREYVQDMNMAPELYKPLRRPSN
jgi:hypothetical protein